MNDISTERKEKEVAQQESINSNAALEQVVKGAHTSETIRAVAREEVDNRFNSQLTSLQQAVEELQQQQKQKAIHLPPRSDGRTQQKQYHSRPITKQKRDKEQHNHHEGNNQHQHVKFNLQSGKAFQASNSNSSRLSTSALQNTSEPPERGPVSRSTMDTTVTAQRRKRSHSYANAQLSEQSSNSMKRSKNTSNQSEPKKEQRGENIQESTTAARSGRNWYQQEATERTTEGEAKQHGCDLTSVDQYWYAYWLHWFSSHTVDWLDTLIRSSGHSQLSYF